MKGPLEPKNWMLITLNLVSHSVAALALQRECQLLTVETDASIQCFGIEQMDEYRENPDS